MLGSGSNSTRGNTVKPLEMPPLTQCLPLEPITLGNQKYTRSGELRRVLGVPFSSTWEDHSPRATHSKPAAPVATEELKHIKESVQDSSNMARDRVKLLDENIFKLDKFTDTVSSKKRQRSDHLLCDRSGVLKLTKIGSQMHRNSRDSMPQRLEERPKNVGLNKRPRTSAVDGRADARPSTISRMQMVMEKDEDMLHAGCGVSARMDEKIRRLPTGGEGWDKKIKKKRSIGVVSNRVINADQDVKRHTKIIAGSKLRSCDTHGFRLKSSSGIGGIKLEGPFEPSCSGAGTAFRNEPESVLPARDRTTVIEQRVVPKANNKPDVRGGIPIRSSSTLTKAKISRAPRTGSVMLLDSSLNLETSSSEAQGWEQPTTTNKVQASGEANSPKILRSTDSSSHPMARWVGQRPHNNSRMRRSNLLSPVSNHVETQISAAGIATSEFSARTSSVGTNGSILASSVDNNIPKFKRKVINVSSPVGLSESEESGAGEERLKGKQTYSGEVTMNAGHKLGSFAPPIRKNKVPTNDIGDGVRKQERSGRFSSLTRPGIPPLREKLDNLPTSKPLQTIGPSSDKSKSKSGRPPSKKLKDRKAVTRVGPMLNAASPDYTGESDDDHEELYAAANSARNASNVACSGPFWKKIEPIFAPVSSKDASYMKQQLNCTEELDESLSAVFGIEYNDMVVVHKEGNVCSVRRQESQSNKESVHTDASCGRSNKVTPLYQRVLSALIEEDENEEFFHHSEGKSMSLQYVSDDSHCGSCNHVDSEHKEKDRMESEAESRVNNQSQKNYLSDKFSCDKSVASNLLRRSSSRNSLHSSGKWQGDDDVSHSDSGLASEICQNDICQLQPGDSTVSGLSSSDSQYQLMSLDERLMLELQSIGLCPERLPDLAEEELINQDIMELKEELYQQIGKKKKNLGKINKAIQNGKDKEIRNTEQVAMDQLIEIAYRKRLACRGGKTSKSAARKVSRQVALAFVKRSLARCRKFENSGSSCFGDPALQDVIFSAHPCNNDAKSVECVGSGTASNTYNEASNHQEEAKGSGAVSSTLKRYGPRSDNLNRGSSQDAVGISEQDCFKNQPVFKKGKKREVLIEDVVGSASSRVTSALDRNVTGGMKGKRSQRDGPASFKGERKTKAKPKLKNNPPQNSENGSRGIFKSSSSTAAAANPSFRHSHESDNKARPLAPPSNTARDSSEAPEDKAPEALAELDTIELGVSDELGEAQDLTSWLNFDEDGLQDHYSAGLEIPMDDLSDLMLM